MRYISLPAVCMILASCGGPQKQPTDIASLPKLNESTLYNRDSVLYVYDANRDVKSQVADKQFLKAIELYRNKKDAQGSLALFKAAIFAQPQAKTYYEMGNALSDVASAQSDDGERTAWLNYALDAYHIAEALNYKPLSKLLFNKACIYARMDDTEEAIPALVAAIELGYDNINNIYKDKDLANLRRWGIDSRITKALEGASDPDKLQWNLYYHEFAALKFPVQLDIPYAQNIRNNELGYDFERFVAEMRDEKFSRETGSMFYRVGIVRNTDSVKTLVYAVQDVMMNEDTPPYYFMASYSNTGKLIDKILVAGHQKLESPFAIATIQESGDFAIKYFELVYEKDPAENGYTDNKVLEQKELNKELYTIASDGHFVKRSTELGMLTK